MPEAPSWRFLARPQPPTSAVLREPTAEPTAEEPTVPPPPSEGTVVRDPQAASARGDGLIRLADPAGYQVHQRTAAMPPPYTTPYVRGTAPSDREDHPVSPPPSEEADG